MLKIIDRKRILILLAVAIVVVLSLSLGKKEENAPDIERNLFDDQSEIKSPIIENITREFYMGLTPFPYDITQEAVEQTYRFLSEYTDLIAHHFDSGVPWPEAYNQQEYHEQVIENINTRIKHQNHKQVTYLAVTPLNSHRTNIAGYWAEEGNQPFPDNWKNITFTDQRTITAYLNFCEYMISKFDPKYMAYGIEVNMLADTNPEQFPEYIEFTKQVYTQLKQNHPELPLFLTFQIDFYYGNPETQIPAVKSLLPYTDMLAVSSYPFTRYPDPSLIPGDYFSEFASLATEKPFTVAETGFPSDSIIIEEAEISVSGTAEWQKEYAEFLFTECQSLKAEFIVWFVPIDYDATWNYLIEYGVDPIYKLWIDTGLLDQELKVKPVLGLWDDWLFNEDKIIESTMEALHNEKNGCSDYPKIASWLAKKDELIQSKKPYDLVMAGWFTPAEAKKFRENNPDVILLAGLTATWVWENEDWQRFLVEVSNYGKEDQLELTEEMYLHNSDGERCAFGWASEEWQHEEIYAMDPRNSQWIELITSFYRNLLEQPQHDGIIVDMVVERQYWCSDTITDEEWLEGTKEIYRRIDEMNTEEKLVIFNAGARFSDIDEYAMFFDGYLMENFMGNQLKSTFSEGLLAGGGDFLVVYGVDTDDTGVINHKKMRLGLVLSLLFDNTYFSYDFGPRDHGQAWWFDEYDVDLGEPLGDYYEMDGVYFRDFENGVVVAAPNGAKVSFDNMYVDISTGEVSTLFEIEVGEGRIYLDAT